MDAPLGLDLEVKTPLEVERSKFSCARFSKLLSPARLTVDTTIRHDDTIRETGTREFQNNQEGNSQIHSGRLKLKERKNQQMKV